MPSNNACAYGGCTSVKRKDPNLSFHRFPRDEQTCRTWIARSGSVSLAKKSREKIENERICCKHFSDADFIAYGTKGKRVLRAGAVPIEAGNIKNSEFAKIAVATPVLANGPPVTPDLVKSALATPDVEKPAPVIPDLAERVPPTRDHAEVAPPTPDPTGSALVTPDLTEAVPPTPDLTVTASPTPEPTDTALASLDFADPVFATPALILDVSTSKTITNEPRDPVAPLRKKGWNDTPKERQLKRTIQYLRAEIKKKNQIIRRQDVAAKKLVAAATFAKAAYALNANQLAFFKMQLNHAKKRQWSEDEKQFALSLYRKSPSAYNYLRDNKGFALPCVTLIQSWTNNLASIPGVDSGNWPN